MILQWLQRKLSGTIYVRVYRNTFKLRHIETGRDLVIVSTKPFSTKRLLIGDFVVAEQHLRDGIKQLCKEFFLPSSPEILIQPMELIDDGISPVEARIFLEVAHGAGGSNVRLWLGPELTDREVLQKRQSGEYSQ